jgi:hypothetical protein
MITRSLNIWTEKFSISVINRTVKWKSMCCHRLLEKKSKTYLSIQMKLIHTKAGLPFDCNSVTNHSSHAAVHRYSGEFFYTIQDKIKFR